MSLRALFDPLFRALSRGRFSPRRSGETARTCVLGREWDELLEQLELPPQTCEDLLDTGSLHPHFHYRHFTRPKKAGGLREMAEPDVKLKQIQRAIIASCFKGEPIHHAAVAYRKKKSVAHHVWPHAGAEVLVTADVQDFFTSTRNWRIQDWWRQRVEEGQARLLTLLTTYQGGLPQGAPTSPDLSNLVNLELDERLAARATSAGARFTRYCDDMVFSWRWGDGPSSDFENGIRATLHEFGYTLHQEKGWRLHFRRSEPEITGVILTRHGRVRIPDQLHQVMRNLSRSSDPRDAQRLAGYEGYKAMIARRPRR
jgi:hypothetical protein